MNTRDDWTPLKCEHFSPVPFLPYTLLLKGTHQAERQSVYNCDRANNDIFSRVMGGQKERRDQIACSGDEDATMDKG